MASLWSDKWADVPTSKPVELYCVLDWMLDPKPYYYCTGKRTRLVNDSFTSLLRFLVCLLSQTLNVHQCNTYTLYSISASQALNTLSHVRCHLLCCVVVEVVLPCTGVDGHDAMREINLLERPTPSTHKLKHRGPSTYGRPYSILYSTNPVLLAST